MCKRIFEDSFREGAETPAALLGRRNLGCWHHFTAEIMLLVLPLQVRPILRSVQLRVDTVSTVRETASRADAERSSQPYRRLFFRFLLDCGSVFDGFSLGASPMSSKGRFVPDVGVLAELVHASCMEGDNSCGCVPGITSLGSDNIAR
jgi:hypothetical protein